MTELRRWHLTGISPLPRLRLVPEGFWDNYTGTDLRLLLHVTRISLDFESRGISNCSVWLQKMPFFLTMALENPFVMSSLLAFSASYIAWITRNHQTRNLMLLYRGFALNGLRRSLYKLSESISEAVLAASILLLWQANEWQEWVLLQRGITTVFNTMTPGAKYRSELAQFLDDQNDMKDDSSSELFCGCGPAALDTVTANLLDMQNSFVQQLHGSYISQLLQFIQKLQSGGPFVNAEEAFDRLRPLNTWLLWLPPALLAEREEEASAFLILSHYYAVAIAITSTLHFSDLRNSYLGSLSFSPFAFVRQSFHLKSITPKFCDRAHPLIRQYEVQGTTGPILGTRGTRPLLLAACDDTSKESLLLLADERLAPNLALSALNTQIREAFNSFVTTVFPGIYFGHSARVEVNLMDWLRCTHVDNPPSPLSWAIRSLSTYYLGKKYKDSEQLIWSRYMYNRGLNRLACALHSPTSAMSDETLAAAILLGVYEMMDGTAECSWLSHSRGIAHLIRSRGPSPHRNGIGRTLLISFRSFLVLDAFLRGESCFLESSEWQSAIKDTVSADERNGKKSVLGAIVDNAFSEVTRCPGLFIRTQNMIAQKHVSKSSRKGLIDEIHKTRKTLADFRKQMTVNLVNVSEHQTIQERMAFFGSIPTTIACVFAQHSLHGIRSALALLDKLYTVLEPHASPHVSPPSWAVDSSLKPSWKLENVPASSKGHTPHGSSEIIIPSTCQGEKPGDWLDRIQLAMGMLTLEPL
ncbi:hypothetical protein N7532_007219 [Penicillium argentinense]|uniref:Transcription factor domain-containing protein n=1 Tax=Penicillium argentinense TaxID=1131581 RepID=A0A9W9F7C1_9EURO|nr:uncharacterized protein N7532_007219 [Penicillium argentinense]KAJ5094928.1 hypothetical protein N7532_007219 [Penicillium argentinense]